METLQRRLSERDAGTSAPIGAFVLRTVESQHAVLFGFVSPRSCNGASRLLKKSGAFADEARVVTVVDIELPNEATRGADHSPSATAGGVILVVPFP